MTKTIKNKNLTFRARTDMRDRLAEAAAEHNRSISEEIEGRLEASFEHQVQLAELQQRVRELEAAARQDRETIATYVNHFIRREPDIDVAMIRREISEHRRLLQEQHNRLDEYGKWVEELKGTLPFEDKTQPGRQIAERFVQLQSEHMHHAFEVRRAILDAFSTDALKAAREALRQPSQNLSVAVAYEAVEGILATLSERAARDESASTARESSKQGSQSPEFLPRDTEARLRSRRATNDRPHPPTRRAQLGAKIRHRN